MPGTLTSWRTLVALTAALLTLTAPTVAQTHTGPVQADNSDSAAIDFTWSGGDDGRYAIENVNSGEVLDVSFGSERNGTSVQQWAYHGGDNQLFRLVEVDDTETNDTETETETNDTETEDETETETDTETESDTETEIATETDTETSTETETDDGFDGDDGQATDCDGTGVDSDDDGLTDCEESELGTDPEDSDADDDGLPDGPEVEQDALLPDADPLHYDVYVEIDWIDDEFPAADEELANVREAHANAAVESPDGENGIALHFARDEQVDQLGTFQPGEYYGNYANESYQCAGYHYAVVTDRDLGDAGGYGGNGAFSVISPNAQDYVSMHELGHSLGLTDVFDGIDSTQYTVEEYPSAMNSNAQGLVDYSDGTNSEVDHDDWGYIDESGYDPGWDGNCA